MLCGNKDKHIVAFIAAQQVTVGRLKLLKKLPSNSLISLSNYNRKVSFYRGSNSWFDRDEYFLRNAANSLEFSNYFLGELWAMKRTVEALPSPKCWCSHLFTDLFHLSANTYVNFTNTGWGPQRVPTHTHSLTDERCVCRRRAASLNVCTMVSQLMGI